MSCICGYLHFTRDLQYESFYLSQYILQFIYHKVFPSADKRYWRTYKLKICDEIKNLSVRDLSWEIIKGRAELDSKFTFIWSSVVFGVISAGIFTYGLDLATQVIVLGPATKEFMITTVYFDFLSMISLFTLVVSFAGWLVALFMELPGGRAWWFYGIFFVISVLLVVIGYLKHTIIIDFVFLSFFVQFRLLHPLRVPL